jgi:lipopolysaccharide transport system ATP-binding protein
MSDRVIDVQDLGKRYQLGASRSNERYTALRDVISEKAAGFFKKLKIEKLKSGNSDISVSESQHLSVSSKEEFWALKDVSFEVNQGEVVGIIGRNGAGKSTLLKILSRITEPTEGKIRIKGRVASLLEVGTGFHPELTGRENVYLNGAILGMTRAEIRKKFDEIVAFAEVERFLDTPVKRYSSGMYVRLAFAVAAHLEPEILVVDEVLAVGDAEFQKKCLGKMREVATGGGRTVLFVSHNMNAVVSLCSRALLLQSGRVTNDGEAAVVARIYGQEGVLSATFPSRKETPQIVSIATNKLELAKGNLVVDVTFESPFPLDPPIVGLVVNTPEGIPLFGTNARIHHCGFKPEPLARGTLRMRVDDLPLHSGLYSISAWLGDSKADYDAKSYAIDFEFVSPRYLPSMPPTSVIGSFDVHGRWEIANRGASQSYERAL